MQQRTQQWVVGCSVMVMAMLSLATLARAAGALDGKTFAGEIGEKGKTTGDKDKFVFRDDTFRSTACDKYGFTAASYTAKAEGDTVSFEAEATSKTDGIMKWMGKAKGGAVVGTALWTKNGKTMEYWFKGAKKQQG